MAYGDVAAAYDVPRMATPEPEVASALHELAEATHRVANTSAALIEARNAHQEACSREMAIRDNLSKLRERDSV